MLQTYLIFGDIEGKLDLLRVECTKCDRKGRYHVHKLIEKYGRMGNMMKWREMLNADCTYDVACPHLPKVELLGIRKFEAGQEVGCFRGKEVRVDRDEHGVRIALGKFNVTGRDLDHFQSATIPARLRRRTQIAPTNFDLCHARLIPLSRQCSGGRRLVAGHSRPFGTSLVHPVFLLARD
jgi:hypothetical protein